MFPPDADNSPYIPKNEPPDKKVVNHSNTRLPGQTEDPSADSEPPTPTRSFINAAITGTPCKRSLSSDAITS